MISVCIEFNVIDPNVLGGWTLNTDSVLGSKGFANLQVANDDIMSIKNTKTNSDET